jgi:uncharacterized surface protein with fasciclin (FAS1) repeats
MYRKLQWLGSTGYGMAALFVIQLLTGCSKDPVSSVKEEVDRTRIGYILEDNFNFSVCQQLLVYTGQTATLKGKTSATFLAPANSAFKLLEVSNLPVPQYSNDWCTRAAAYNTLPGLHSFRQLPLGDNQAILSGNGHHVYISRYLQGADTITRVNGAEVSNVDIKASNGYLQVVAQVLQPENATNIAQLLLNDTTLTLFAQAMQQSGLMPLLQSKEYTVLAPANAVMRRYGAIRPGFNVTTPDSILAADPNELTALLKYHLLNGRSFLDRLHRQADTAASHSLVTLNGEPIVIGGDARGYNTITFSGNKNTIPAKIYRASNDYYNYANFPAGNGVVHHIDNILLP